MEKPILFSTEMVNAILAGNKTMTRRVFTGETYGEFESMCRIVEGIPKNLLNRWGAMFKGGDDILPVRNFTPSPYGFVGDLLWVRETTCIAPKRFATPDDSCIPDPDGDMRYVSYKADGHSEDAMRDYGLKWTPSIHVPKWAARIWLKVKSVRVESLQDASEEEAEKEGIDFLRYYPDADETLTAKELFMCLWDSINGKPRKDGQDISWKANPWVWVVEFERTEKPQAAKEEN